MDLEAKEFRVVILALKSLLKETEAKLKSNSEGNEDCSSLVSDAMLVESMIAGFEEDYENKWG